MTLNMSNVWENAEKINLDKEFTRKRKDNETEKLFSD